MPRKPLSPAESTPFPRPLSTVDVIILTLLDDALQVLLVQRDSAPDEPFPGQWALPGGIVDTARDLSLEDCARRKLKEKTGVDAPYLEQIGSWGDASRDPRGGRPPTSISPCCPPHPFTRLGAATSLTWHGSRSMAVARTRSRHLSPSTTIACSRPESPGCAARRNTPHCRSISCRRPSR